MDAITRELVLAKVAKLQADLDDLKACLEVPEQDVFRPDAIDGDWQYVHDALRARVDKIFDDHGCRAQSEHSMEFSADTQFELDETIKLREVAPFCDAILKCDPVALDYDAVEFLRLLRSWCTNDPREYDGEVVACEKYCDLEDVLARFPALGDLQEDSFPLFLKWSQRIADVHEFIEPTNFLKRIDDFLKVARIECDMNKLVALLNLEA
jgi:hypothetical protein